MGNGRHLGQHSFASFQGECGGVIGPATSCCWCADISTSVPLEAAESRLPVDDAEKTDPCQ